MSEREKMDPTDGMQHISQILPRVEPKLQPQKSTAKASDIETVSPYQCDICQDFHVIYPRREDGSIDASCIVPCRCARDQWKREKVRRLLQSCELPAGSEHMTFEGFRTRCQLQEALDAALAVSGESAAGWLTLMGGTDCGKTHLAVAICRRWLSTGRGTRYAYVPLLLEELKRGFRQDGDGSYEVRFDYFLNVPLLVMDDLGAENRTPWVQEKLDTIIDYRLMHGLGLVVTTNCTMKQLPFRIASRLERNGKVVYINADGYNSKRPLSELSRGK